MTMGEGGFVTAKLTGKGRRLLASLRDWGRACFCNTQKPGNVTEGTACGFRFGKWLPGKPEAVYDHRYVFDNIGYNLKPLELQACMGLEQIKKLPSLDRARRENHLKLYNVFDKYKEYFYLPEAQPNSDPCWFAFLLTVREGAPFDREDIVNFLEDNKIQTRSYFCGNVLAHPAYNYLVDPDQDLAKDYPVADVVTTNSFFLGTFAGITDEKVSYISKTVDQFLESL
jgi:CDP-6-deoxy-D-xylo-4-hexulose-3-dehydrase